MKDEPSIQRGVPYLLPFALAGIGLLFLQWLVVAHNTIETIPYSRFEELVGQGPCPTLSSGRIRSKAT